MKYIFSFLVLWIVLTMIFTSNASILHGLEFKELLTAPPDTNPGNKYPLEPVPDYPSAEVKKPGGIQLKEPSNVKSDVQLDPETGEYVITDKVGSLDYRSPRRMTLSEYQQYTLDQAKRNYWREKAISRDGDRSFAKNNIGGEAFDKIFGTNVINIQPQGSAELIFGYNVSKIDNPTLPVRLRTTPSFNFEERIQMNVQGTIGNRVKIGMQYNTEATFEFENKTKLEYTGEEDEIIKKIEVGNVTMPLSGSLITGSHSLFGIKTEMQFGKLFVTSVLSQQKGQSSTITMQGGAQTSKFEVFADQYEANKHFFLAHLFEENYDRWMKSLPVISSGVQITRIEVWVTNKSGQFESSRNIAAFMDLGESDPKNFSRQSVRPSPGADSAAANEANNLYAGVRNKVKNFNEISESSFDSLKMGINFEKIENARKLTDRDFTINAQMGYISLNTALNADEVLAVAYEYQYKGVTHQVGQFSTEKTNASVKQQDALVVKLLKGTNFSPKFKNWNLMMKNIYSLNAYQISPEDFMLFVLYQNDRKGTDINFLPEPSYDIDKEMLLRVLNLDGLNSLQEPYPDGLFDYIEGMTINSANGRVIFPVRQPFGKGLKDYFLRKINPNGNYSSMDYAKAEQLFSKYGYQALYDSTLTKARLVSEKNKFKLAGTYKSSSGSEIYLNAMNIPQGSVKVTANGVPLQENSDYTVDYTLGRVKILNQGVLSSGNPIKVSLENQSLFNMQTKTLVGTNLVYKFNDDFNLGATIMHLNERPLTQKVNLYSEPISNTIWGLNGAYRTQSDLLTTIVDKLPFFSTKTPSEVTLMGEFAQLIPGSSKAIGKNGVAYIDDFEGSETTIELKTMSSWKISSIPVFDQNRKISPTDLSVGFNRAKLCWYVIDPLFTNTSNSLTPSYIKTDESLKFDHFTRAVQITEVFPKLNTPNGLATTLPVLNLAFYPKERGPYNYNPNLTPVGYLNNPTDNWGGIMRELQTTDFEASNVQYIEFWIMDPYWKLRDQKRIPASIGKIYFDLGDISEDVLPDNRKSFENGLPRASVTDTTKYFLDKTAWAVVPLTQSQVKAFDNNPGSRKKQDVGLDGMNNAAEQAHFADSYLSKLIGKVTDETALKNINDDPSADDYHYFRWSGYDEKKATILDRYKDYNGLEGNSPENTGNTDPSSASTLPDDEDINRDNTLNQSENYYEYEVPLEYNLEQAPYYTSRQDFTLTDKGKSSMVTWYQFKVPLEDIKKTVGDKQDFKSIRFMRIYLKGFSDTTILRFAKLELVRGEWRKYNLSLYQGGEYEMVQNDNSTFDVTAVNIEKNSGRSPINYVLPPGIDRVIDPTNPQIRMLNEQSMVLRVNCLPDGDARAAFKTVNMDLRQYKRLKMFIHGERLRGAYIKDYDLSVFIRIGADYKDNYYEYDIPLKLSDFTEQEFIKPRELNSDNKDDRRFVWQDSNIVDIDLTAFQDIKLERNKAQPNDVVTIYSTTDKNNNKRSLRIRGNPSLSNVRTIMIGVRNPKNDGLCKSAEVWINELRLTDFNNVGGWGANGRTQIKLADLGMISVSGSIMTPGFGSIEKKVNEREKVETNQLDLASNIDLGKFFKEDVGVQLPVFASYSKTVINPQYDPLKPDIPLDVALNAALNEQDKTKIKKSAQDYTERVSLNLTNAKIGKPKQKPRFYDPANFSTTLSYNHIYGFNPTTISNQFHNYRGGLNYMFSQRAEPVQPFKNVAVLNKKAFTFIKDFNFYWKPQAIMFRTELNRSQRRLQLRDLSQPFGVHDTLEASYMKDFSWNRLYDVKFDLTRAIKLTYNGTNVSRIDEYYPTIENPFTFNEAYYLSKFDDPNYIEKNKRTMWKSFVEGGRTINYKHNFDLTYTLPINKIPGFDWLSASARYGATYAWDRQPKLRDESLAYGNTIKNGNTTSLSGQGNLVTLYNKVPYLKKLNTPAKKQQNQEFKTVNYEESVIKLKAGSKKTIRHNLGTEDVKVKVKDKNGVEVKGDMVVVDKNKISFTPEQDQGNSTFFIEGKVPVKPSIVKLIVDQTLRTMMGVKTVGITYTLNQGTTFPGFKNTSHILGMDPNNGWAPGVPFIFGMQDNAFYQRVSDNHFDVYAVDKHWNSTGVGAQNMAVPMIITHNDQINLRSSIEPLPGLKVDLTEMRNYTESLTRLYNYNNKDTVPYDDPRANKSEFFNYTEKMTGQFSMSFLGSFKSFFEKLDSSNNYSSKSFDYFRQLTLQRSRELGENRIADQGPDGWYFRDSLGGKRPSAGEYYKGYGPGSQQVVIPALLSAYSGINMNNKLVAAIPLNALFLFMPNWRVTFDGLGRIEFLKKYFKSIVLTHAYQATYNVGSFISNYRFDDSFKGQSIAEQELHQHAVDLNGNFISKYDIGSISINESFNPLLSVDMTWANNLTSRFGYRSMRNLMMSFYNNQMTETRSKEWTVGLGYRFTDINFIMKNESGASKNTKSDLKVQADVSIRDDKTIFRKLIEETITPNSGKQVVTVKISADYMISSSFTLRIFYDRIVTNPFVSNSYKTTNSNIGFSVRFTLVQQ